MSDAEQQANKKKLVQLCKENALLSSQRINSLNSETLFYTQYWFSGNSIQLSTQLDIRNNRNNKSQSGIKITVTGMQINQPSKCLELIFFLLASLLFFPIFFMCCDWYRRMTRPIYEIKTEIYKKLAGLNRNNTLKYLELKITDNLFNQEKATIIYNLMVEGACTGFIFVNAAQDFDVEGGEYSNFDQYMKIFKTIPNLQMNLRWQNKTIR